MEPTLAFMQQCADGLDSLSVYDKVYHTTDVFLEAVELAVQRAPTPSPFEIGAGSLVETTLETTAFFNGGTPAVVAVQGQPAVPATLARPAVRAGRGRAAVAGVRAQAGLSMGLSGYSRSQANGYRFRAHVPPHDAIKTDTQSEQRRASQHAPAGRRSAYTSSDERRSQVESLITSRLSARA